MTISNVASSVTLDGDGVVTDFAFTFPIRSEDDLKVTLYQISTEVYTELTLGQISYTGIGSGSTGGSVHYPLTGSPLSSDYKIIISRDVSLTQDWSTSRLSDYDPSTLEEALDRIVMGLQQVSNRTAEIQVLADDFEAAVNSVQALVIAVNSAADTAEEWAEIAEEAVLGIVPDGTVSTIKLADGAVTTAKLDDGAVTLAKWAVDALDALAAKAPLAGAALTDNPTAPTQPATDDTTRIATTAHVHAAIKADLNASGSPPLFAIRAWASFNGTGTISTRGSGNVSSITDLGIGQYQINFTTALPDANYATLVSGNAISVGSVVTRPSLGYYPTTASNPATTSSVVVSSLGTGGAGTYADVEWMQVAVVG